MTPRIPTKARALAERSKRKAQSIGHSATRPETLSGALFLVSASLAGSVLYLMANWPSVPTSDSLAAAPAAQAQAPTQLEVAVATMPAAKNLAAGLLVAESARAVTAAAQSVLLAQQVTHAPAAAAPLPSVAVQPPSRPTIAPPTVAPPVARAAPSQPSSSAAGAPIDADLTASPAPHPPPQANRIVVPATVPPH